MGFSSRMHYDGRTFRQIREDLAMNAVIQSFPLPVIEPDRLYLLTAREAARYLRISLSTLYRLERDGQLASLRTPGGHRRYTVQMLNACLSNEHRLIQPAIQ
jgi:excisionase family DNA binding protein